MLGDLNVHWNTAFDCNALPLYRRTKLTVHKDVYGAARLKLNSLIANIRPSKIPHLVPNSENIIYIPGKSMSPIIACAPCYAT